MPGRICVCEEDKKIQILKLGRADAHAYLGNHIWELEVQTLFSPFGLTKLTTADSTQPVLK